MNSATSLIEHHDALPAPERENPYTIALQDIVDGRNEAAQRNLEAGVEPLTENPENFTRIGDYPVRNDIVDFIRRELGDAPSPEDLVDFMDQMKSLIHDSKSLDVEILAWETEAALKAIRDDQQGVSGRTDKLTKPVDEGYGRRYGSTGANKSAAGGLKNPRSIYNPN